MKLLVIDLGSYSVKFVEYKSDKKTLQVDTCSEIIIAQLRDEFHPDTPMIDMQLEIVEGYLNHKHYDGKIIYQMPHSYLTTRFVQVPVGNKKKAELMIPFQLEENIPFPLSKSHYVIETFKNNNKTDSIVHISNLIEFENFYNELGGREILPALLSPESSFIQSYVMNNNIKNDVCFVNIGHSSTKAYYFNNGLLSSIHVSHVAGKNITEVISQTYQIPTNEASIYKHNNCFFLTGNQYAEVDEDQREFANIMKQAVWPLVLDLKRWDLGFRVNHGKSIERIYLMGGTSKIKNFRNFLSQAVEVEIEILNLDHLLVIKDEENKLVENNPQFVMTHIMGASQFSKAPPVNLLTTQYSSGFTENIPLHSTGFIAARVAFFSLILIFGLIVENVILKNKNKKVSDTIRTIVKRSSDLKFTKKESRELGKSNTLPKTIKLLVKKNKEIAQQVKLISAATRANALQSLTNLSRVAPKNTAVDLIKFESSDGIVTATFSSEDIEELKKLENILNGSALQDKEISLSVKQKVLELTYQGN